MIQNFFDILQRLWPCTTVHKFSYFRPVINNLKECVFLELVFSASFFDHVMRSHVWGLISSDIEIIGDCRPRPADAETRTSLRSERYRTPVVQFIPLWQNFPSRLWRQYVINRLHPMFRTTRFSAQSASVDAVHGGSWRPRRGTWRQFARVCRRHAAIRTLSSRRRDIYRSMTLELHPGSQPLHVFQLSQAQCG